MLKSRSGSRLIPFKDAVPAMLTTLKRREIGNATGNWKREGIECSVSDGIVLKARREFVREIRECIAQLEQARLNELRR
jgi:hypothetical protein